MFKKFRASPKKQLIVLAGSTLLISSFTGLTAYLTDEDGPLILPIKLQYGTNFDITIYDESDIENSNKQLDEIILAPDQQITFRPALENTGDYDIYVFIEIFPTDDQLLSLDTRNISNNNWYKLNNVTDRQIYAFGDEDHMMQLGPTKQYNSTLSLDISITMVPDIVITEENRKTTIEAYGYAIQADGINSDNPEEVWKLIEEGSV